MPCLVLLVPGRYRFRHCLSYLTPFQPFQPHHPPRPLPLLLLHRLRARRPKPLPRRHRTRPLAQRPREPQPLAVGLLVPPLFLGWERPPQAVGRALGSSDSFCAELRWVGRLGDEDDRGLLAYLPALLACFNLAHRPNLNRCRLLPAHPLLRGEHTQRRPGGSGGGVFGGDGGWVSG